MKRLSYPFYFTGIILLALVMLTSGCPQPVEYISVPNVVGMALSSAQAEIIAAGLVVGIVTEVNHESIPVNEVIGQEPEAGTEVNHGTAVDLTISADVNAESILLPGNVPLEMLWIPPGSFMMGSPDDEQDSFANEGPQHEVTFAEGFWMGKYPITQAQWQAVMGDNPSRFIGANRPVERVTWDDIRMEGGFLDELNAILPGYNFRLPSEAEWEYAYRAGTTTRFYWGDDPDYTNIDNYAWYYDNAGLESHDVGLKLPNPWGLYDMAGNVWEWCEDDWHINYIDAPDDGSPWTNEPRGSGRLLRGGSWYHGPEDSRAASRNNRWSFNRYNRNGLRIVFDLD